MPVGNGERDGNSENRTAIIFGENFVDYVVDVSTRGHLCEGPPFKSHKPTTHRRWPPDAAKPPVDLSISQKRLLTPREGENQRDRDIEVSRVEFVELSPSGDCVVAQAAC